MFSTIFRFVAWTIVGCSAAAALAADPWIAQQVMPKSDQLMLRVGREYAGDASQIAWPAKVERTEGQWLWLADHEGCCSPAVCGWVSKEEVLKLDESYDYYLRAMTTSDTPWLHWALGVYLERNKESTAACREYLRCLGMNPAEPDSAIQSQLEEVASGEWLATSHQPLTTNHYSLDALVRLARLKAAEAQSATDAEAAASVLHNLSEAAQRSGIRRPQLLFEQAEVYRKLCHMAVENGKDQSQGFVESRQFQELFRQADDFFARLTGAAGCPCLHAEPCWWKGRFGRAELYLDRADFLRDEVRAKICGRAPVAFSPARMGNSTRHPEAGGEPDYWEKVKDLNDSCRKSSAGAKDETAQAKESRHTACRLLIAEVYTLRFAVDCFDEAIVRNPGLIEAYRDRGFAWFALAEAEGTLAAFVDDDPELSADLALEDPQNAPLLAKLDRTLWEGHNAFYAAVGDLGHAIAKEKRLATRKKRLLELEDELVKQRITPVAVHAERAANDRPPDKDPQAGTAYSRSAALSEAWNDIEQLRKQSAQVSDDIAKEEEEAAAAVRQASAALEESYKKFHASRNLREARQSAYAACEKSDFAGAESLYILATVYAAQCNFERAEFYQKLAAIFASDEDRPGMLEVLEDYRAMLQRVTTSKVPKIPIGQRSEVGGRRSDL